MPNQTIEFFIDLETTNNGGPDGTSPEAHWQVNRVLQYGWKRGAGQVRTSTQAIDFYNKLLSLKRHYNNIKIVAHNLKFDLKYLMRDRPDIPWHHFEYVCTMSQTYRQSGQQHKFPSLEDSLTKYGITYTKRLDLKKLLAAGLKMEDIDEEDLRKYLEEDVYNLYELYFALHHYPQPDNFIAPLAEMELNGLFLDEDLTKNMARRLLLDEQFHSHEMKRRLETVLMLDDGTAIDSKLLSKIKFNAPRTISYILTGEPSTGITIGTKRLVFKKGWCPCLTHSEVQNLWQGKTPTNLGYPVPEKILKQIEHKTNYALHALTYRKVQKLLNTYVQPFLHQSQVQGCIYPKLNYTSTNTTRLSSSNPNGQNMPEEARKLIESTEGKLIEVDFKQLEFVSAACVTKDKQLIKDLNDGEDIHYNTGSRVFSWKSANEMDSKTRKQIKFVNFGLLYGGTAGGLSESTGQPKALVRDLIQSFYHRYPGVKTWQEAFYQEVADNLQPFGIKDGEQIYDSIVNCKGTRYHFVEQPSPTWLRRKTGRGFSFSPTQIKNYPVQGFAGGTIVMLALWCLWKEIKNLDLKKTKLRLTVHDSILIDTDRSEKEIGTIMDRVCQNVVRELNLPVNLEYDMESGTHWS